MSPHSEFVAPRKNLSVRKGVPPWGIHIAMGTSIFSHTTMPKKYQAVARKRQTKRPFSLVCCKLELWESLRVKNEVLFSFHLAGQLILSVFLCDGRCRSVRKPRLLKVLLTRTTIRVENAQRPGQKVNMWHSKQHTLQVHCIFGMIKLILKTEKFFGNFEISCCGKQLRLYFKYTENLE